MSVSTNALDMVRIVRRAKGPGYYVQQWTRHPDATSWIHREDCIRLTLRGAMRQAIRWPGPLTIEAHQRRELRVAR